MTSDSTRFARLRAPSHKTTLHTHPPNSDTSPKPQAVTCASDQPATDWRFPDLPLGPINLLEQLTVLRKTLRLPV